MITEIHPKTPGEKALKVNIDGRKYGSFSEIGAGQEVVRWFFRVGGGAGTIAKSMSAYDMKVSDAIYGKCDRYVSRDRLQAMIDHEQTLNVERLTEERGDTTAFFSFADTVAARNYQGTNECHGWMGIKFQAHPRDQESQIIIHVRMLDNEIALQQEALGIVGVNLVYGACFLHHEPDLLVESLLDGLSIERIEIDMIEFSGIEFRHVDNRIMSLRLVQLGLSGAAMFSADGKVLQPSEHLRKKPLLVERGRFRPVTNVNIDMLESAMKAFEEEDDVEPGETVQLMEITMRNLMTDGEVDLKDFLARAEVLAATGHTVLISDYFEYYRLAAYLSRYTNRRIGLAIGLPTLAELFEEKYYETLDGGILESFGRLFKNKITLYVYPKKDMNTGELMTIDQLNINGPLQQLYQYLVDRACIYQLTDINKEYLDIFSPQVLKKITDGESGWEEQVPKVVAKTIKKRCLFGYCHIDI